MKVTSLLDAPFELLPGAYTQATLAASRSPEPMGLFELERSYTNSADRIVELGSFDIIHAHDWLTFRAAVRLKQQTGKPLILHVHATEHDRAAGGVGHPFVREVEYNALSLADQIITVSNVTKQVLTKQYHIPPDKIEVVYNRLEIEPAGQSGSNVYRYLDSLKQEGYQVVVYVGRITIQKGLSQFLRAMREVIARRPKTVTLLVGDGDQTTELIRLAARLRLSRHVLFAGFQRGKPWHDAFAIGDLFVMPSVSEPFGLAALEAMSHGIPTLVSKQAGVTEVVHNVLSVDFWDERRMADEIAGTLTSSSLRQVMGMNGRCEVERLTWDQAARELTAVYEKVGDHT